mmetsp:Transcript_7298/g.27462  ORF Transcript_7298/g.27462 Transcript_7298/m.27462 type:complete len:266 (+) Transcript_7298:837-1634(+)
MVEQAGRDPCSHYSSSRRYISTTCGASPPSPKETSASSGLLNTLFGKLLTSEYATPTALASVESTKSKTSRTVSPVRNRRSTLCPSGNFTATLHVHSVPTTGSGFMDRAFSKRRSSTTRSFSFSRRAANAKASASSARTLAPSSRVSRSLSACAAAAASRRASASSDSANAASCSSRSDRACTTSTLARRAFVNGAACASAAASSMCIKSSAVVCPSLAITKLALPSTLCKSATYGNEFARTAAASACASRRATSPAQHTNFALT